jgi:hypothetical protein
MYEETLEEKSNLRENFKCKQLFSFEALPLGRQEGWRRNRRLADHPEQRRRNDSEEYERAGGVHGRQGPQVSFALAKKALKETKGNKKV